MQNNGHRYRVVKFCIVLTLITLVLRLPCTAEPDAYYNIWWSEGQEANYYLDRGLADKQTTNIWPPEWFEVVQSQDQRSLVIPVQSDRPPQVSERRKAGDVPDQERELRVRWQDGLLDIHARNARLSELVRSVSEAAGVRMLVDPSTERLVNARLPEGRDLRRTGQVHRVQTLAVGSKQGCGTGECGVFYRSFHSRDITSIDTQLLIFITPRILDESGHLPEAEETEIKERMLH